MDKIVEELKKIKEENGLTNAAVAEMSGVPVGTVNRVFSGTNGSHSYATIEPIKLALLPLAKPEEAQTVREEQNKSIIGKIELLYERLLGEKDEALKKSERRFTFSIIANIIFVVIFMTLLLIDIFNPFVGWIRGGAALFG